MDRIDKMMTEDEIKILKATAKTILSSGTNRNSPYHNKTIQSLAQGIIDLDHDLYLAQVEIRSLNAIIERDTKAREAFLEKSYREGDNHAIGKE
jgi:hypothetical protein